MGYACFYVNLSIVHTLISTSVSFKINIFTFNLSSRDRTCLEASREPTITFHASLDVNPSRLDPI